MTGGEIEVCLYGPTALAFHDPCLEDAIVRFKTTDVVSKGFDLLPHGFNRDRLGALGNAVLG
jgi:hypothetical protein